MGGRRGQLRGARVIQRVQAHEGRITVVCWSRHGGFLASAGQDGVVRVWGVAGGRGGIVAPHPLRELTGHSGDVLAMAWSRSDFLASAAADRTVRLWHPQTELCLRHFVHPDMVTAVAFHPNNDNCLATGGCDGVARVWRPAAHACVSTSAPGAAVSAARFSADGDALLVGCYDGSLLAYEATSLAACAAQLSPAMAAATPCGQKAVAVPPAQMGELWRRVVTPSRRRRRPGSSKVCSVASLSASAEVVVVTADARAHVFGEDEEHVVRKFKGVPKSAPAGALQSSLSPDGRFLVVSADGGDLNVLDFAYCRVATHGIRRLVRDETLALERIRVMGSCTVTAAEFASEIAVNYSLGEHCVKGAMVLAVGGDDGSLKIVNNISDYVKTM